MRISHLRVNHLDSPLGMNCGRPCFRGSCRICHPNVRRQHRFVSEGERIIYDSLPDPELDQRGTELPVPLKARTRYRWRVTVRGDGGDSAAAESSFETGKMNEAWRGSWITPGDVPNAILEQRFSLCSAPLSARIYISGLGLYRLFINGRAASDEVLTPGLNAYDRWVQVQTFDVGALLGQGENLLEIWLAGGISRGRFSYTAADGFEYCPYDCAIAELRIETDRGEIVVPTNEDWSWCSSPIVESSIYDGEIWEPGRRVRRGQVRLCTPPVGPLRDRLSPPVRIIEERKPLRLITTPAGETVLDMGQNMAGWLRFPVGGPKGRELRLQLGEQLENGCFSRVNLRSAKAAFIWYCDGADYTAELYSTWYGFRYVLLEGFDRPVDPEDFTACVVSSALEECGHIATGHPG